MKRRPAHALLLAPALSVLFLVNAPAAHPTDDGTGVVVVPNALTSTEGSSNNTFPFGCVSVHLASQRYQQVYSGTEVGSGNVAQIAFRPDERDGWPFGPTTIPGVTITLSTTTRPVDGLSTTFADNVGADVTTVYSGDLALSSADTGPGPRDFDIRIPLQQVFAFNSSAGNLLVDVTIPTCKFIPFLDATTNSTSSVSRQYTFSGGSTSPISDAPAGSTYGWGLVTQFTLVNADTTAPTVTITSPVEATAYTRGQVVNAGFSCADESDGSGMKTCSAMVDGTPILSGDALPTGDLGSHTLSVTATDNAGNTTTVTRTYAVFASFGDSSGRLESPPVWNSAIKAGATVPVRFSLGGDYGTEIFATGSPRWTQVRCPSGGATDLGTDTEVTGDAGLNYDPATDQYNYRWKTDRAWVGQCWQLSMTLIKPVDYAGATMRFNFKFDK